MRFMKKKNQPEDRESNNKFWTMDRKKQKRKLSQKISNFFAMEQGTSSSTTEVIDSNRRQVSKCSITMKNMNFFPLLDVICILVDYLCKTLIINKARILNI